MSDDVKKALEWLRGIVRTAKQEGDLFTHAEPLLAHIDAEPERLAAAVAREREEQREADVRSCPTCKGEGFMVRVRECPFCNDSTHDHECPTDEVKVYCACGAARLRATPLTSTPLADELERAWNTTAKHVDERDAALLRVKELEGLIKDGMRVANALTLETQTPEEMAADLVRQVRDARTRAEAAEAERDALKARVKELKTALHLEREAHGRALREALDPVVRAKMMEPPPPLLLSPDVASSMSERDALKTQLAEAVEVLASLCDQIRQGRGFDTLEARAFLAKYPEGR